MEFHNWNNAEICYYDFNRNNYISKKDSIKHSSTYHVSLSSLIINFDPISAGRVIIWSGKWDIKVLIVNTYNQFR